jgi:predicted small secreted protein
LTLEVDNRTKGGPWQLLLAALLLAGCATTTGSGQTTGGSPLGDDTRQAEQSCAKRGGEPVVFGGNHTPRTIVCFNPEVLR